MDLKITKKRLFNLIAYDWIKAVAFSLALVFAWVLLFTTCATRATDGQQFYFALYGDVNSVGDDYAMLGDMKKKGDLSYDVLTTSVNSITAAGNYSAQYMLNLRSTTHEADVILLYAGKTNKVVGEETGGGTAEGGEKTDGKDETTENTEKKSDIEGILSGRYLQTIEDLTAGAKAYLEKFGADFTLAEPTVDDAKIERYFRAVRAKEARNYKKTYRTENDIKQGVKNEQARIKKLLEAYLHFNAAVAAAKDSGNDFLRYYMKPVYENGKEVRKEKRAYGVDLTALNKNVAEDDATKQKVNDRWSYPDEKGNPQTEGLTLCVSDYVSVQRDLQYEALTFLDYIVRNFSNY